jgi:hypothetical protein
MAGTAITTYGINDQDALAVALREEHNKVITDLETLRAGISEFEASATQDWGALADHQEASVEITVTGAALGDFAWASLSVDIVDYVLKAAVTAANTVTVSLVSHGPTADLASATMRVRTASRDKVDAAGDLVAATINEGSSVAFVDNG